MNVFSILSSQTPGKFSRAILAAFVLGSGHINSLNRKSTLNTVPHFENIRKKEKKTVKKIKSVESLYCIISNKPPMHSGKRLNTIYHIKHVYTDYLHC